MFWRRPFSLNFFGLFAVLCALACLIAGCSSPKPPPAPAPTPAEPATPTPPPGMKVDGQIQSGEGLAAALTRVGVSPEQFEKIRQSLETVDFPFKRIRGDQPFTVWLDENGVCRAFDFQVSRIQTYHLREKEGALAAERVDVPTTTRIETLGARVYTSVYEEIIGHGHTDELASLVSNLFAWDINFYTDPRRGDSFKLVFERTLLPGGETYGYGRLLAAEYDGQVTGLKRGYWLEIDDPDFAGFYDENGTQLRKTFLVAPLDTMRITSRFGLRLHPVLGRRMMHSGVDYGAAVGTPVWAVADGKVLSAGHAGAAGNLIKLAHDGGYVTMYMHLSRIAVRTGQHVRQRQLIGRVGSTGRSTGPHLDFRIQQGSRYVNPLKMRMIASPLKKLPEQYRSAFAATIEQLKPQLEAIAVPEVIAETPSTE